MLLIFILPIEKLLHTLRISCLVSRAGCSEWQFSGDMPPLFPLIVALGTRLCPWSSEVCQIRFTLSD